MSSTARLGDPELLTSIAEAIHLFQIAGYSVLAEVKTAIGATEDRLARCQSRWQREVQGRSVALQACLEQEAANHDECSGLAAALAEAQQELANVEDWIRRVDAAVQSYQSYVTCYQETLDNCCVQAREFLLQKGNIVQSYSGAGVGGVAATGVAAGGGVVTGSAPAVSRYAVNGNEFADVPLGQIEEPQFAPSEWATTDVADMQSSFARLPQIRQAIHQGTIGQLIAHDPVAQRVFDWFYGGEAVFLEWHQGMWTITNGKHRVAMAKVLGLPTLPARVRVP